MGFSCRERDRNREIDSDFSVLINYVFDKQRFIRIAFIRRPLATMCLNIIGCAPLCFCVPPFFRPACWRFFVGKLLWEFNATINYYYYKQNECTLRAPSCVRCYCSLVMIVITYLSVDNDEPALQLTRSLKPLSVVVLQTVSCCRRNQFAYY